MRQGKTKTPIFGKRAQQRAAFNKIKKKCRNALTFMIYAQALTGPHLGANTTSSILL